MKNIKAVLAVVLVLFAQLTNAESLLPLPQVFNIGQGETVQGSFGIAEPTFTIFVQGVDSNQVTLTLPNGTVVTETSAAVELIDWSTETNVGGETLLTIASSVAASGNYQFNVTARPLEPGSFAVVQSPGLSYRMFIGNPGATIEPGQPFGITTALFYNNQPATGGNITVDILNSVGALAGQVVLQDDGLSPDINANDGVYTSVKTLNSGGQYNALLHADWNGHKGRVSTPFTVEQTPVSLTGTFSSVSIDADQNGKIEGVKLTYGENSARLPGTYEVTAEVTDSAGVSVTETVVVDDVSSMLSTIFTVEKLNKLGAQPWHVTSVNVWSGVQVVGVWKDLGELVIDPSSFERNPMVVIGISGDRGVDSDADGIFERFEVDIQVEAKVAGSYGVSSDLRASDRTLLGSAGSSSSSLVKGVNTITLRFLGSDIGSSGQDGPYSITNFLIYPNFASNERLSLLVEVVGKTGTYTCNQFTACDGDMAGEIRRIANSLCDKHGDSLLKKIDKVERLSQRHPDVAERQLSALLHRATTLERSGSCPPAIGWSGD